MIQFIVSVQGKSTPSQVLNYSKGSYSTPPHNNRCNTNLSAQGLPSPSELTGPGQSSRSPGSIEEVSSQLIITNEHGTENFSHENFNISDWVENYDRLDGLELSPGEENGGIVDCTDAGEEDSRGLLGAFFDELNEGACEGNSSGHVNGPTEVGGESTIEMLKNSG